MLASVISVLRHIHAHFRKSTSLRETGCLSENLYKNLPVRRFGYGQIYTTQYI